MRHITKNHKFLVSTSNVFGTGWETLVFAYGPTKQVIWEELDGTRYASENEAIKGHYDYVEKWENKDN